MLSLRGLYSLSNQQWAWQMPLIVLASACGGLLGAAFNLLRIRLKKAGHRGAACSTLAWAGVVAAATALAATLLPAALGRCLETPHEWDVADVVRHNCPEGQYNDLGTALLSDAVWVIKSLLQLGSDAEPINNGLCSLSVPCYYSARTLAVFCAAYLLLMVAASSTNVPGGLFMPAIMVGASFGALYGLELLTWLPGSWDIQPGLYSLVAATATLGGVFRNSISLVVVVVEGTRGIDFLFGIITAVVVSNYVAHLLHPHGVYESDLEKDGTVFFLRPEPPHALRGQTAGSVMASPALGFPAVVPAAAVVQALAATTFNAFVVYDPRSPGDAAAGVGRMEGLVTRDQLRVLLRRRAFADEGGRYLNPPEDQAALEASLDAEMQEAAAAAAAACSTSGGRGRGEDSDGMLDDGAAVPGGGDGWEATSPSGAAVASPNGTANSSAAWDGSVADPPGASPPGDGGGTLEPVAEAASPLGAGPGTPPLAHLNLRPFSNLAALTVRPETPCPRVYQLFLSMSLRHLPVVDDRGIALGMITRKDLDHAAGSGSWRVNPVAPAPTVVTAVPPTWLRTISTQALRSLAVPAKARRLISVLSHRLSVSPHSAGSLLQRGEDDTSVAGGSSDASAPSPRPAWPQSPQRPGGGGARQQRQGPPPPDV